MAGITEALLGRAGEFKQAPPAYSPQQLGAFQNLLGMGMQGLGTDAIEGAARRGYQQQTIPLLQERFAKAGGIGSSGYQNSLKQQGSLLESNLAALRQGNAMDLLRLGLTPTQDYVYEPGTEGQVGNLINMAVDAGLAYATGGLSKAGNIMDLFRNLFGGNQNAQVDIGTPATNPVQSLYNRLSGNQLLQQAQQSSLFGAPSFNRSLSSPDLLQRGRLGDIQRLLYESTMSGIGQNAPQAFKSAQYNQMGKLNRLVPQQPLFNLP